MLSTQIALPNSPKKAQHLRSVRRPNFWKSGLPEKCRDYVLSNAELPNSVSFDNLSREFTKEDSHFVIYRINFTAKNYFNTELSYTATCTVDEFFEFYGNLAPKRPVD